MLNIPIKVIIHVHSVDKAKVFKNSAGHWILWIGDNQYYSATWKDAMELFNKLRAFQNVVR